MKKIIDNLSTENRFSFYSSFFRIFICIHLLKDVISSWGFKDLLYMSKSFYSHEESLILSFLGIETWWLRDHFQFFYLFYIIVIIMYFFGIGRRITAIILYILYEVIQSLCPTIQNGGDNLLKFIILYMIFIDSYDYFSVKKDFIRNEEVTKFKNFLSNIFGFSICIHLCLAYFVSAIHKIHADVWFNGVATYYTLSLERFRGTSWNLTLVKNGLFVTLSTYATILIELFYPVLVWFDKTKKAMILLAIFLHIGIYIFMMIYDFQLVFIFVQGFFISNKSWLNLYSQLINNKQIKNIYGKITSNIL
jgi:hypothetical protein